MFHGAAAGRQILEREIDAPTRQIILYIPEDIGELERHAELERVVARALVLAAEDLDADHPDG